MTDDYLKETQSLDRVWRLVNKYYTANVRVHALPDHCRLEVNPDAIEAHVILITEDEVSFTKISAYYTGGIFHWTWMAIYLKLILIAINI